MSKKQEQKRRPTFEVRLKGPGIDLEAVPLRAVSDALSAVQDLACARDPFQTSKVSSDQAIGLVRVKRGSAVYVCYALHAADALTNIHRTGQLLSGSSDDRIDDQDRMVSSLKPIEVLSAISRQLRCEIEVRSVGDKEPLLTVDQNDYERIAKKVFLTGETSISGRVMRVGGATGLRCLLRVPGRPKLLYCDLTDRKLAQLLGQHLYETIIATGTATWIHKSWMVYKFSITSFSQPKIRDLNSALDGLRSAGLDAWDHIDNPEEYLEEFAT